MPWTAAQHRLFAGIAHGSIPPRAGLTREKATELMREGIILGGPTRRPSPKELAQGLDKLKPKR